VRPAHSQNSKTQPEQQKQTSESTDTTAVIQPEANNTTAQQTKSTELPAAPITAKKPVSGLSLKGLKRKKEILEKQTLEEVDASKLPRESFTEVAMQAAWKEYVSRLQKKGEKILASNLETDTPTLQGTTIHLEFPNETMKIELERAQGGLLEFLKRKLRNYDITIAITVNEAAERKYAYTTREKYEKLKDKNPDLELLRKTFDLDI
tara:strand:+ start:45243 stop:45863 length:621 start_codon:yes stop_codon:yes gene_type:complete